MFLGKDETAEVVCGLMGMTDDLEILSWDGRLVSGDPIHPGVLCGMIVAAF